MDTKIVHYQPGVLLCGYQQSVGVPKIIFFPLALLHASLNLIEISLTPAFILVKLK